MEYKMQKQDSLGWWEGVNGGVTHTGPGNVYLRNLSVKPNPEVEVIKYIYVKELIPKHLQPGNTTDS